MKKIWEDCYYNDRLEEGPFTHPCHFPVLLSLDRAAICSSSVCHVVPSEELVTTVATSTSAPPSTFCTALDLAASLSVS